MNPLDTRTLDRFISGVDLDRIMHEGIEPEALSDRLRMELLQRYGGVWADATTICAKSLDTWLHGVISSGFFAFSSPGPDRMLSTWFLAAEKGNYIIEKWRERIADYWQGRKFRSDYFWVHNIFREAFDSDQVFQHTWENTQKLSAKNPFHFGPNAPALFLPPSGYYREALKSPPVPVFKLTHKLNRPVAPDSLMSVLCDYACEDAKVPPGQDFKRILVGWYGSIPGHGTIGDLRSLESVVSHLAGRGHEVRHATAAHFEIPGSERIDWRQASPDDFDGVIFVCGPILKNHPQTREFFDRYALNNIAGVGVSLLPEEHVNHYNPFNLVLARQGGPRDFGDLAIVAPRMVKREQHGTGTPSIGLALRGPQGEYGHERCMWRQTNSLLSEVAHGLARETNGKVLPIENHLKYSGLTPAEIEDRYLACDLILTSRFHGAVTAMGYDRPFIAVDQISGGAKVYPLLTGLGWPHVYKIDEAPSLKSLMESARGLLHGDTRLSISRARNRAVREANRTLCELDRWVGSL